MRLPGWDGSGSRKRGGGASNPRPLVGMKPTTPPLSPSPPRYAFHCPIVPGPNAVDGIRSNNPACSGKRSKLMMITSELHLAQKHGGLPRTLAGGSTPGEAGAKPLPVQKLESATSRHCRRRCAAGARGRRCRDRPGCLALAETDSVLLSDRAHVNALAYLAQHLIVLLDPADIVVNIHHAYHRPEFRDRHYAGSIPIHPPPQISRSTYPRRQRRALAFGITHSNCNDFR